jgi:4-amino-4-deoxy-L-arabinose transferase-like glycosyltransferase
MSSRHSVGRLNWLVTSIIVLHLVLAVATGLSPDEAHYALYAYHLDWSYYDHPPLVGWLQWPFVQFLNSDLGLRTLPMLLWLISLGTLVQLVDELFPSLGRIRIWHTRPDVIVFSLSPMLFLLGMAWVPDTLLLALTCRVMLLTWRLAKTTDQATRDWCELGFYLGLAGLSKYTAVLLAIGVVLSLTQHQGLAWLKRRGPWLAFCLAALCIVPVIYWNISHDWASLRYQIDHAHGSNHWRGDRVLSYFLILLLVYGAGLLWWIWQGTREASEVLEVKLSGTRLCLYFGLPGLALFLYLSGGGRTLPHWPANSVLALLPLAALGCARAHTAYRSSTRALLGFQLFGTALVSALMLSAGIGKDNALPGQSTATNPFADLHGWNLAATHASRLAEQEGANSLAVMNWTLASRIAWYARPMSVKVINSHKDQFDIWFGPVLNTDKVILVNWSVMHFAPPTQAQQFSRCTPIDSLPVVHLGRQIAHFDFLLCDGWQGHKESSTP